MKLFGDDEKKIDWHFPRKQLADAYLRRYDNGLVASSVLFAPRKKGKTEFALYDLIPAAEAHGYRSVYVSMWQNRLDPLLALCDALEAAAKPRTPLETIVNYLKTPLKKTKVKVGEVELEAEFEKEEKTQVLLQRLPQLFDKVIAVAGGKVLLIIDEVQLLARPEFHPFVAALRTTLDLRKQSVKTLFTGSSRNRLQQVFTQIKAPLFQFSQTSDFPDLGQEFVNFMVSNFSKLTEHQLKVSEANQAFELLGHTPGLYQDVFDRLVTQNRTDILVAAAEVLEESRFASGYIDILKKMPLLDRAILMMIMDREDVYSDEVRAELTAIIGLDPSNTITTRTVQYIVERLIDDQIIFQRGREKFEIEDHQLADWLDDEPALLTQPTDLEEADEDDAVDESYHVPH